MPATLDTEADGPTDEALMSALKRGDDVALGTLMGRWELPVKAFLLRLGVPKAEVDDIAQDAFVRLYEKRDAFREGAAFKPWLLTIAGNLGRNRRRWWFRRKEESLEAAADGHFGGARLVDEGASSALELAERASAARQIRTAVQALPSALRDVVVCVELEELSYADAAQVLRCSAKAVETRLYRARQMLRSQCDRWLKP